MPRRTLARSPFARSPFARPPFARPPFARPPFARSAALAALALAPGAALAQADLPAVAPVAACESLLGVDLADLGGAGSAVTEAAETTSEGGVAACSVRGTLAPDITFAVVLPTATWTGRYLQLGCGGLCGRLSIGEVGAASGCAPLNAGGFAVAATDMGHQEDDEGWGSDPQRRADFAHRAQHLTARAGKRLVEAFYGRAPAYAYFNGCSDGGREALVAAQRTPEDFDGIIAGAPAMSLQVQNTLYHGWQDRANRDAEGQAILLAGRLPVLHAAVLARCDGLDGVADGLLADPLACDFDPGTIRCEDGVADTSACLTGAEVEAARRLYAGARDPETGAALVAGGPMPGSELRWTVFVPEEPAGGTASASHVEEYLPLALPAGEEAPTLATMPFTEGFLDRLRALHPLYDATNPDLSAFEAAGGKLLLYHGWSDTDISPVNTIAYFEAARALMGAGVVDGFARLYLVPGMYHCSQGEGPYELDLLTPLMAWVEEGAAPDAVLARQPVEAVGSGFGQFGPRGGAAPTEAEPLPSYPTPAEPSAEVVRARPLYPYPALPALAEGADPDQPESWSRGEGRVAFRAPDWAGADLFRPYEPLER